MQDKTEQLETLSIIEFVYFYLIRSVFIVVVFLFNFVWVPVHGLALEIEFSVEHARFRPVYCELSSNLCMCCVLMCRSCRRCRWFASCFIHFSVAFWNQVIGNDLHVHRLVNICVWCLQMTNGWNFAHFTMKLHFSLDTMFRIT